jgi:hypothetical protein
MGATIESVPVRAQGLRSSSLKRRVSLQARGCRILVEPDGSVRAFHSLSEGRALFGHEQLWFFKVQAGIVVHAQRPDWGMRVSPRSVQLIGRIFDGVEVGQAIEHYRGRSVGYLRRLKVKNGLQGGIKLKVIQLLDPTAAHFGDTSGAWGSLGVNAFNRESHVAMDEISDPPSARVVGSSPSPSKFYMTTNKSRAQELVSLGELPEATAGMSGQVLIVSVHEVDLGPSESKELTYAAIYNPGKLEEALADFSRLQAGEKQQPQPRPLIACSEQSITDAAAWALTALDGGSSVGDPLDRYETLKALGYIDPTTARKIILDSGQDLRKDGSLPHSMSRSGPGLLETAVLLQAAALHLALAQEKKPARAAYPLIRKLAGSLMAASKDYSVQTSPELPQGWRRHLGRGFPTGEIPEVTLAVAGALVAASQVARLVAKSDDGARYRERAEMISDQVAKKLIDERGYLALCSDSAGRLRTDETVDMAVAAYRYHSVHGAEQASAHRLLEKDFDTIYGPRCVPTSNQLYFNRAYGQGQLGGVWTRAVLAFAVVCYRAGLAGIGSLALGKVSRLVTEDAPRLGGYPGEFPLWVDVDVGEVHGDESDPVAAARFLEALVEGELGIPAGTDRPALAPAASSSLGWLMGSDLWVGEAASVFLGRGAGTNHIFFSGARVESKIGTKFAKSERLDPPARGIYGIIFHTPGQVLCLGNSTSSQSRFTLDFSPRAAELTKHLSTPLEEYDPVKGAWTKTGSLRVFPTMSIDVSLEPNAWKAYRISTP